jgi:hypothetical protein
MLTLEDLRASPERLGELADADALIAAASGAEVVVHTPQRSGPATTMVFQHETIAMMRAERAAELEKLALQLAPKSVVVPMKKKPGSFWDQITVGRASTNDIVLGDPAVSNVHAHFEPGFEEGIALQDLGSSNGTFLNREPMQPHVPRPVRAGDCIRFGQSVFYFVSKTMLEELLR